MSLHDHVDILTSRAALMVDQRNYAQAMDMLKQALAQQPDHGQALYLLAFCQLQTESERRQALDTIDRALAADPHECRYHSLKAAILCNRNECAKALKSAEEAVSIDPLATCGHIEKGRALMGMQRWKEAEAPLRDALALDADDPIAENLLTTALQFQNRTAETAERIGQVLSRDPQNAHAHANAGWSALRGGDLQQARFHFLEALRIDPQLEHARVGVIETFKAKSPLYRVYLNYCFAMARLQPKHQIMLILGLFLLARLSRHFLTGSLQSIGTLIAIAYMLFALWSWVARGIGNLFLLLDSFARHALRTNEKIEALLVGGNVLVGLPFYVAGIAGFLPVLMAPGMFMVASAFPFSATFTNENPTGRKVYGIAGAYVWSMGVVSLIFGAANLFPQLAGFCLGTGMLVAVGSIWMGAFGVLRR
jgi:tetratricopeptide (TPR) repeat protein